MSEISLDIVIDSARQIVETYGVREDMEFGAIPMCYMLFRLLGQIDGLNSDLEKVKSDLEMVKKELSLSESFNKVAIKERNYERHLCSILQKEVERLKNLNNITIELCDCVYTRDGVPDNNCKICCGIGALVKHNETND